MQESKRVIATISWLVALSLVLQTPPAHSAAWDFPDFSAIPENATMIALNEPNSFDAWNSWNSNRPSEDAIWESHLCPSGPDDQNCNPDEFNLIADSILPACESELGEFCVESLRFVTPDGQERKAEFVRQVGGVTYEGIPELNLVGAETVSLWSSPEIPHAGGTGNYSVLVKLFQKFDKAAGEYEPYRLSANVNPFSFKGSGEAPKFGEASVNGVTQVGAQHDASCVWAEDGNCGVAEDFPEGVRVELSVRFPSAIAGWLRGRLQDPKASIEQLDARTNRLTLNALPVKVPRMVAFATEANTSAKALEILNRTGGKNAFRPLFTGQSAKDFWANGGQQTFDIIQEFREATNDTAAGISSLWNFTTLDSQGGKGCLADTSEVLGIVTTNATGYLGDPPSFEGGELVYKVAGLHFAPDGSTVNLGTYDLVMRSEVARCLYGFSKAPVSAQVQVLNENGEEVVATTVVSERDGWLKLAAYGFTFSEKEIKVRVTQPQTKTLTNYRGSATALTAKQKAEIKATVTKGGANPKFICTGIRIEGQPQALNTLVRKRAKLACDYAKSLNPKLSTFYQTKTTKARSYNGKVLVVSK